jgi:hypothetical protein
MLNWTGDMSIAAQERRYFCVHKRGNYSPLSKIKGFVVYAINKKRVLEKMFITRGNVAS